MEKVVSTYLNDGEAAVSRHLQEIESTEEFANVMATFMEMVRCCSETNPEDEDDWEAYDALRDLEEPGAEDLLRFLALQAKIENLNITWEGEESASVVHAIRLAQTVRAVELACYAALTEEQISQILAACELVQFLDLRGRWPWIANGIGHCRQLQVLEAKYCGITAISPAIAACSSLRILWLQENQLTRFPLEVCSLPRLEELDLYANGIVGSLPQELSQLQQLRKLGIAKNAISDISVLGLIPNIVSLKIEQNPISNIPTALPALEAMTFSTTQVAGLAASLLQYTQLQSLIIVQDSNDNLDLTFVGDMPSQLTSLEIYPAEGRLPRKPISALHALAKHKSLEMLSIFGTDMTHIPAEWIALTSLKRLLLAENDLAEVPAWLVNLHQLQDIYLFSNQLRTVPDELLAHPKLLYLKLAENPIPEAIMAEIATKVAGRITL